MPHWETIEGESWKTHTHHILACQCILSVCALILLYPLYRNNWGHVTCIACQLTLSILSCLHRLHTEHFGSWWSASSMQHLKWCNEHSMSNCGSLNVDLGTRKPAVVLLPPQTDALDNVASYFCFWDIYFVHKQFKFGHESALEIYGSKMTMLHKKKILSTYQLCSIIIS